MLSTAFAVHWAQDQMRVDRARRRGVSAKRTVCHDETNQTVRLQGSGVDPVFNIYGQQFAKSEIYRSAYIARRSIEWCEAAINRRSLRVPYPPRLYRCFIRRRLGRREAEMTAMSCMIVRRDRSSRVGQRSQRKSTQVDSIRRDASASKASSPGFWPCRTALPPRARRRCRVAKRSRQTAGR